MQTVSRKIVLAMLWELWRVSRFELMIRLVSVSAFILLVFSFSTEFHEGQLLVIRGVMVVLLGISCVFSTTWMHDLDNQHAGFTFRLGYTRPISSLQLVIVPMVYSVVTSVAGYLVCALIAQVILGQPLPLLGPSLIFGCIICLLTCVTWSSTHAAEKIIGLFLTVLAIICALLVRHELRPGDEPILLAMGDVEYFDLAWYECLGLVLTSVLSVALTVVAVGRQRYSEGFRWNVFWSFLPSLFPASVLQMLLRNRCWVACKEWIGHREGPRPFRGAVVAQWWFDLRRTELLFWVACVWCACVLAFVVITPLFNESWGGAHSPRLWLGATFFSPLIYQLLGTDPVVGLRHKQGSTELSLFDATRPLRCDQLIAIKLLVVAGRSLFGFLLMLSVAAIHATAAGQWHHWNEMGQAMISAVQQLAAGEWGKSPENVGKSTFAAGQLSVAWYCAGLGNLMLLYFSSASLMITLVLCVARYSKLMAGFSIVVVIHACLLFWDASHDWPLSWLWRTYSYLVPISLIMASLCAMKIAIYAGYLSWQYFLAVFCFWSIYIATASTAVAPLALASLRHR